jgi:hypothetical protein
MTIEVRPLVFKPQYLNGLIESSWSATTRTTTAARCAD